MLWNRFEANDETNNTGCWISVLNVLILPGGCVCCRWCEAPDGN